MWRFVWLIGFAVACAGGGSNTPPDDASVDDGDNGSEANTCVTQPCDILTTCGCAGGMACDIDFADFDGTACRDVSSPGKEVDTCATGLDCAAGYACIGIANNGRRFCKRYCDADDDCNAPGGRCVIDITNGGTPIPGIPAACTSTCDPVNVAASGVCPASHKCRIFSNTHDGVTQNTFDCAAAGTLGQGGNCTVGTMADDKLCAPDHLCTGSGGVGPFTCRRMCTSNANCAGLTCFPFNPRLIVQGTEFGVCN